MAGREPRKTRPLNVVWEWESTRDARARLLAAYEMLIAEASKVESHPFDSSSAGSIMPHDESG